MKIATFGSKVFTVSDKKINTFGTVSRSSSYNVDEQENGTNKPKLKNKAPGLDTLSFDIDLRSEYVNVRNEIEDWIEMQGENHYFIVGNEKYGNNKWKLVGVDISNQEFTLHGVCKSAKISLSFKEYATTKSNSSAKSTRNTKG